MRTGGDAARTPRGHRGPGRTAAALLAAAAVLLGATGVASADSGPGAAATYYVSAAKGNDGNRGTSAAPWRSIKKAVASAAAGSTIMVQGGTYQPFTVTQAGLRVVAVSGQTVVVAGRAGVQDVIRVAATDVTLKGMTVAGCVPSSAPSGGFEQNGSSAIRVNDGATNATIDSMTIRDSRATNSSGLRFGCYGILVHNANGSVITGNDISGTGDAIYFNGGGRSARISGNRLHDNDVIIRNTPGGNDDFGGTAITFTYLTASPGPRATGNRVWNNAGPSSDYGTDGGAFEIYNASNVQIDGNTLQNNENVLETGTYPGGGCTGNVFSGNQVSGRTSGSTLPSTIGLILRCATRMKVENNTFSGIEGRLFQITAGDQFSSNVDQLTIHNNKVTMSAPVYQLDVYPASAHLVVDGNQFHVTGGVFATYGDGVTSYDLQGWRNRTGLDLSSSTF